MQYNFGCSLLYIILIVQYSPNPILIIKAPRLHRKDDVEDLGALYRNVTCASDSKGKWASDVRSSWGSPLQICRDEIMRCGGAYEKWLVVFQISNSDKSS